jgi:diguanylate cyclase
MSQSSQSPSDIAREVLRRLAMSRIPPTPDNFRKLYEQIAGVGTEEGFPERELRALAASLPRDSAVQERIARRFEGAISDKNWANFRARMQQLFQEAAEASPPWGALIRDLLVQLERRHEGVSASRKREALEHVLSASQGDAQQLFQRLQGMIRGWRNEPVTESFALIEAPTLEAAFTQEPEPQAMLEDIVTNSFDMRLLVAQILEEAVSGLLVESPELTAMATALASELRLPSREFDSESFASRLRGFAYKVEWVAQDQTGVRNGLVKLLQLVMDNINDLVLEDSWFQGQIADVLEVTSGPLDRKTLDTLGRRLRDLILKQGVLKKNLVEAQERLRSLLGGFVDHLSAFYDSTGEYHERMERCAAQVANASSISDLSAVIDELVRETRGVQLQAESSRTNLSNMREQVQLANNEIARLQTELAATSQLVRHDPLTGTLNRKGMDETLTREIGRALRQDKSLCLALIDIDNFKQINDRLGHRAGDDALVHLAHAIGDLVRPQDSLARYGGEEFVIVLPDTTLADAALVVRRLQREVTRRFFLHDNRKLLITFSAGVCELRQEESPREALDRADEAMYRAKRAGKNRVEIAG